MAAVKLGEDEPPSLLDGIPKVRDLTCSFLPESLIPHTEAAINDFGRSVRPAPVKVETHSSTMAVISIASERILQANSFSPQPKGISYAPDNYDSFSTMFDISTDPPRPATAKQVNNRDLLKWTYDEIYKSTPRA